MQIDRYEQLIAETLRRPDAAAARSLAYAAAKCVLYASECPDMTSELEEAVRKLEESSGIAVGDDGVYRETLTED